MTVRPTAWGGVMTDAGNRVVNRARVEPERVEHRDDHDNLDGTIRGPAPSLEEALTAEIRSNQLLQQARDQVLANTLSRAEAAERLGVDPQRSSRLVTDGDLIALEEDGQLRLPTWQLHPDTASGRLSHIAEVARAHAGDPLTLTQRMLRSNPAVAGRTPVDALIDGDRRPVVAAAGGGWRQLAAAGGGWRRPAAARGGWRRLAAAGGGCRPSSRRPVWHLSRHMAATGVADPSRAASRTATV